MNVAAEAFGYQNGEGIGVAHLFVPAAPELKGVYTAPGEVLCSEEGRDGAGIVGGEGENVQVLTSGHQHLPGPPRRQIPGDGQSAGLVVVLHSQDLGVCLEVPV